MKKSILRILAIALALCLLSGTALAASVYASDGDSYIRSAPSLSGRQLGLFRDGAYATYLGSRAVDDRGVEWYRVSYNGETGWVSSRYTTLSGAYDTVYASNGDSYIRSQPSLSGKQLGLFRDGATATYLDRSSVDDHGVEWYRVNYNGTVGWVSSRYTSFDEDGDYYGYDTIYASGGKSYIRSTPSLSGKQLATFPKGASADYLGRSSVDDRGVEWYRIDYNGTVGWVSSRYTSFDDDYDDYYGYYDYDTVRASGGKSYIRSRPNLSGKQLGTLPDGASGTYLDSSSVDSRGVEWYRIRYNGITGWVSSKYTYLD